jgi:hypothetical protein
MAVLKYYNTATSAWEYIAASTTANFTTWKKTATGGETSVSGTDDNAVTLSYTAGLEQVFINGVLQVRGSDYTATTGTSVTGLTALVAGDIVTVVCYAPFNIANTIAPTVVDAKGDLLAGTAADTVGRLAVGTNGNVLTAASGEATGLKWDFPGKILQVQSTETAGSVSWGDTGTERLFFQVAITPKLSTSNIYVFVMVNGIDNAGAGRVTLITKQNTTSGGTSGTEIARNSAAQNSSGTNGQSSISAIIKHTPASTATRYYKVIYTKEDSGGTNYLSEYSNYSSIVVVEVAP